MSARPTFWRWRHVIARARSLLLRQPPVPKAILASYALTMCDEDIFRSLPRARVANLQAHSTSCTRDRTSQTHRISRSLATAETKNKGFAVRTIQKMLAGAMLMSAAMSNAAHAEDATFTGNIALTTDYEFRGITQTSGNPAVQGGFDYVNGQFYAGVWASNVSFSDGPEVDVYAGFTPAVGPVTLRLGVIGYFYPGAQDDSAEFDYYEAKVAATFAPAEGLSVTGSLYYSPDFFGETGDALYSEIAATYTSSSSLSFSGAFGHQSIDDVNGPGAGRVSGDYDTWNLGVIYTYSGFAIDARYVDTNIDTSDDIAIYTGSDETAYDSAFILTVKRTL